MTLKKKTREELIRGGYCPLCSKCTRETAEGFPGCSLFECRKCGTLLVAVRNSETETFVDVTGRWDEISDWYSQRHEEFNRAVSDLEEQLFQDVFAVLTSLMPARGLTLVNPSETTAKFDPEEWRRKRLEVRGLSGLPWEGERVLQQLLTWAWRRPDRWVPAHCTRPVVCGGAHMRQSELDEHWRPHIDFLIDLGRIVPKLVDGQEGWIVPSTAEWRSMIRTKKPSA